MEDMQIFRSSRSQYTIVQIETLGPYFPPEFGHVFEILTHCRELLCQYSELKIPFLPFFMMKLELSFSFLNNMPEVAVKIV